ncbi:MAG: CBS domain-containing protein [Actinomycetota bacterium]
MKVQDLKLEPIFAAHPDESITEVADRMRFYEVGSLAVIEHGSIVGIITERDIVRATADRSDLGRIPIRFYLTSAPTTVSPDTDVREAASLMLALGIRHLPVVDGVRPVGMVSIRDLLAAELELTAEAISR